MECEMCGEFEVETSYSDYHQMFICRDCETSLPDQDPWEG